MASLPKKSKAAAPKKRQKYSSVSLMSSPKFRKLAAVSRAKAADLLRKKRLDLTNTEVIVDQTGRKLPCSYPVKIAYVQALRNIQTAKPNPCRTRTNS